MAKMPPEGDADAWAEWIRLAGAMSAAAPDKDDDDKDGHDEA